MPKGKRFKLAIGKKTALITIGDKVILLEIIWTKKHWWSISHPTIKAEYA